MMYGIDMIGIKACLWASLFPLILLVFKNSKSLSWIIFLIFMTGTLILTNRASFLLIVASYYFLKANKPIIKPSLLWLLTLLGIILLALINKSSIVGRLFILKIIFLNIMQTKVLGNGYDSFKVIYAQWQSNYFATHQSWGTFHLLADAPSFAFNEPVHYLIEFGVVSPILFISFLLLNIRILKLKRNASSIFYAVSNLVILLFASCSYSLHSCWIISLFIINHLQILASFYKKLRLLLFCITILIIGFSSIQYAKQEKGFSYWEEAENIPANLFEERKILLSKAYPFLNSNPAFIKYYCEFWLNENMPDSAIKICDIHQSEMNQFERRMIVGNSYFLLKNLQLAEQNFKEASLIIPNRFMPLLALLKISVLKNSKHEIVFLCKKIINMPVKVQSQIVVSIKEMAKKELAKNNTNTNYLN